MQPRHVEVRSASPLQGPAAVQAPAGSSVAADRSSMSGDLNEAKRTPSFDMPRQRTVGSTGGPGTSLGGGDSLDANIQKMERSVHLTATWSDGDAKKGRSPYVSNAIRTARYTVWNFLPMNLFEQLSQPANFYFLCIGILQAIPPISSTQGIPTMYIPLTFILFVSGLRGM